MKHFKLSILSCYVILSPLALWLVVYSFFPHPLFARAYFLMTQCTSLEAAEQVALEDFVKGKRQIMMGGLYNTTDMRMIRDSILLSDYNLETLYLGCVGPSEEAQRYSETIVNELAKAYGQDFYDRAQKKTVILWEKRQAKTKPVQYNLLPTPPPMKIGRPRN